MGRRGLSHGCRISSCRCCDETVILRPQQDQSEIPSEEQEGVNFESILSRNNSADKSRFFAAVFVPVS